METTDLKLRKMSLIEYLLGVHDEKIFDQIESSIHQSIKNLKPNNTAFTKKELIERAEFSNNDIETGNILTQEEVEIQSKNW